MVTVRYERPGSSPLILFGLSDLNVARLRERKPIYVSGASVRLPGVHFGICWDVTEQAILDELRRHGLPL
jgi:hypothetical protein